MFSRLLRVSMLTIAASSRRLFVSAASGPVTEQKITDEVETDGGIHFVALTMQGWRPYQEDRWTAVTGISDDQDSLKTQLPKAQNMHAGSLSRGSMARHFFGVFDGHGGQTVSQYASTNLWKKMATSETVWTGGVEEAGAKMQELYLELDEELVRDAGGVSAVEYVGATATTVALREDGMAVCANAGDSRAFLCRAGKAVSLSYDHSPTMPVEAARIQAADGAVDVRSGRVYIPGRQTHNLNLSRSFGDFCYKQDKRFSAKEFPVTAFPDILSEDVSDARNEFIVLVSDGIVEAIDNQEVCDYITSGLGAGEKLVDIGSKVLKRCVAKNRADYDGSYDNMTLLMVDLRKWHEMRAERKIKANL